MAHYGPPLDPSVTVDISNSDFHNSVDNYMYNVCGAMAHDGFSISYDP